MLVTPSVRARLASFCHGAGRLAGIGHGAGRLAGIGRSANGLARFRYSAGRFAGFPFSANGFAGFRHSAAGFAGISRSADGFAEICRSARRVPALWPFPANPPALWPISANSPRTVTKPSKSICTVADSCKPSRTEADPGKTVPHCDETQQIRLHCGNSRQNPPSLRRKLANPFASWRKQAIHSRAADVRDGRSLCAADVPTASVSHRVSRDRFPARGSCPCVALGRRRRAATSERRGMAAPAHSGKEPLFSFRHFA